MGAEYCAWIYYTPDGKYVLSKLTDQTSADPANENKRCSLPPYVDDRRFPSESIQYIFAIHNHLYDDILSPNDLSFILEQGTLHEFEAKTRDGDLGLSVVAFFSNDPAAPRCDGFYQYIPLTGQILKWTSAAQWMCEQTHQVEWNTDFTKAKLTEARARCFKDATR